MDPTSRRGCRAADCRRDQARRSRPSRRRGRPYARLCAPCAPGRTRARSTGRAGRSLLVEQVEEVKRLTFT